jgi:hypothetical protein
MPRSNSSRDTKHPDTFRYFPQTLYANSGVKGKGEVKIIKSLQICSEVK